QPYLECRGWRAEAPTGHTAHEPDGQETVIVQRSRAHVTALAEQHLPVVLWPGHASKVRDQTQPSRPQRSVVQAEAVGDRGVQTIGADHQVSLQAFACLTQDDAPHAATLFPDATCPDTLANLRALGLG